MRITTHRLSSDTPGNLCRTQIFECAVCEFKTPTVVMSVTAPMSPPIPALFPPTTIAGQARTPPPRAFFLPLPSLRDVGWSQWQHPQTQACNTDGVENKVVRQQRGARVANSTGGCGGPMRKRWAQWQRFGTDTQVNPAPTWQASTMTGREPHRGCTYRQLGEPWPAEPA